MRVCEWMRDETKEEERGEEEEVITMNGLNWYINTRGGKDGQSWLSDYKINFSNLFNQIVLIKVWPSQ